MTFEGAKYYDATDGEVYTHTTPEAAIEEVVDGLTGRGSESEDVAVLIRRRGAIKVTAYSPRTLPDSEIAAWASRALEFVEEAFGEEYGDPEGSSATGEAEALPAFVAAVRAYVEHSSVWSCEEVGVRVYTAAEVEGLMRALNPQWFAPDSPRDALDGRGTP